MRGFKAVSLRWDKLSPGLGRTEYRCLKVGGVWFKTDESDGGSPATEVINLDVDVLHDEK